MASSRYKTPEIFSLQVFSEAWGNNSHLFSSEKTNDSGNFTSGLQSTEVHFFHYVVYVVGVLVTTATIVGNVLVIIAVISEKRLRKVGNIFIINLAVSDCLVGIVVSPLAIVYNITRQWVLGEALCDLWVSVDVICCTASILNLCAIAYDRYNAIVQPIKYSRKRTYCRAWIIVGLVWAYAVIIALPRYIGWRGKHQPNIPNDKCMISREIGYTFYSTLGSFFIPLTFMLYFYYQIYCATCFRKFQWHFKIPGNKHFIESDHDAQKRNAICSCKTIRALSCCTKETKEETCSTAEQGTQTVNDEAKIVERTDEPTHTEVEIRRESIEPELLAIYQMRHRSNRILSNVTLGSLGSAFYSSTDSSNTATTSFSESSDRSSSVFSEGRDRSYSSSTEASRSLSISTELAIKRHSLMRSHRLSSARQSSLHTEVIHEIASTLRLDQEPENEVLQSPRKQTHDIVDTDDTHDEMSDDGHAPKPKRKLRSSTFRRRNSRKSRKIAISQEKRAAKTLGVVMGCFIVCWFPFFIVALIQALCTRCIFHPVVIQFVTWLGYFNSACNPFIYTLFNKDFEAAFRRIFRCNEQRNAVYL